MNNHENTMKNNEQTMKNIKEHDKNKCNDARLFRIYERRVISRVDILCKELNQLSGLENELAWVQKSFLPFLNNLVQYYSKVCKNEHKLGRFS